MKKLIVGFVLVLVMMLGFMSYTSPVHASLTNIQQNAISAVVSLLQQAGFNSTTVASIQATLAGGSSNVSTSNGCLAGNTYNTVTGVLCPTALPGTTNTTSSNVTPSTTTTSNTNTTNISASACVSNITYVAPTVVINGQSMPCVKVCLGTTAWNVTTNSICPNVVGPNLTSATDHPSIKLTVPNGGESYTSGESVTMKWETMNIPSTNDTVMILLYFYNSNGDLVAKDELINGGILNDGMETVKLPTSLPSGAEWGTNFAAVVSSTVNGNEVTDMSDKKFTITQ